MDRDCNLAHHFYHYTPSVTKKGRSASLYSELTAFLTYYLVNYAFKIHR
jgi:hypothetical protein